MTGSATETDVFFGFVAGLYAASIVAPTVAIGVAFRVTTDPGLLSFVLLGIAVVITPVVGWVARRESLAVRLGSTRWVWVALVPMVRYFAGLLVAEIVRGERLPGSVAGVVLVGAIASMLFGLGLAVAAKNRHVKAVLTGAEEFARFEAPAPERDRKIAKRAGVTLFAVGVVGFLGSIALGVEPLRWLFQVVVPFGTVLVGLTSEREVAVTDAGLLVATPVLKSLRPWSDYESYSVTDETIVVHRAGLSPWGLRDLRRDPTEVDDLEAVASALGAFLSRRGE